MRAGDICIREVVCAERDLSIQGAAQLMRTRHVGDLVIIERTPQGARPIGIVTDRDLVVEVLAENIDSRRLTVGDIVVDELITAPEDQSVFDTVEQMQRYGIRRLPVIDKQGCLLGIITADDLFELLMMELAELSKGLARERRQELARRPGMHRKNA